jgi:copper transport protein
MAFGYFESGSASAHAVQVGSLPAANSQVAVSPEQISVTFSEPIEPSVTSIQLWDQQPVEIALGEVSFPSDEEMVAQVTDTLPMGIYTVIWRNLSTVDGHTWSGSFVFIVLGPNGEVPQGSAPPELQELAAAPSDSPKTLETAARWLVLLGSAVLLGGVAYVATAAFPAANLLGGGSAESLRSLSRTILLVTGTIAALLVLQGSLLQLVIQADRLGGLSRVDNILTDTRLGNYLIARQALLLAALAALGLVWRTRSAVLTVPAYALLGLSAIGVLLTQSIVSHAAAGAGSFWKTSADFLHLLAASFWIGSLIHIGLAMPRWLDELRGVPRTLFAAESFRRFSLIAAVSVVVIIASGVLSALAQFTSWEQLWDTSYGWSLVAKLALMIPLLAIGALNAFYLGRRVEIAGMQIAGGSTDTSRTNLQPVEQLQRLLSRTVRLEAVLGIAVLVSVGVLIQLEPPRAAAQAEAAANSSNVPGANDELPQDETGYFLKANQAGGLVISLKVEPATVGVNTFEVGLGSEFGAVGEVQLTRLRFANAATPDATSELDVPLAGSAKYVAEGANLSQPGQWDVTATIRRRDQEDVQTSFTIPIRDPNLTDSGATTTSGDRWDWPFEGNRSVGAIVALVVGGIATVGAAAWQLREFRRT